MAKFSFIPLLVLGLLAGAGTGIAQEVPEGKAIVLDRCVSCHDISGPAPATLDDLQRREAPDLFYAGSKFRREWMIGWLQDPTPIRGSGVFYLNHIAVNEGKDLVAVNSIQPCQAKLSPAESVAVTDYLLTLKDPQLESGVVDTQQRFRKHKALRLFRKQLPCIGCHQIKVGKRVVGGVSGPSLTDAGRRLNPDWVYARIEDPQYWDPKTWMPVLPMSPKKRTLLASYISTMTSDQPVAVPPTGRSDGAAAPISDFVNVDGETDGSPEQNYQLYCAQCHGSQGTGRGINDTAGDFTVSPRNHRLAEQMNKLTDEELRLAISKGGDAVEKSGLMPPFGKTLSKTEIEEMVDYLRKLCECQGPS